MSIVVSSSSDGVIEMCVLICFHHACGGGEKQERPPVEWGEISLPTPGNAHMVALEADEHRGPDVRELADRLQLRHNSVVEPVGTARGQDLVARAA
ncbi:hypothetical protein AB0A63_20415 [Lentzea sp. NPDC042327]|uniref:hypothetical protein n=1 Tax=Lentzea sp. NPDC042327 TaxID=3154801 RepID=UPI0033F2BFB5